jgi:microcystin-dependent protein
MADQSWTLGYPINYSLVGDMTLEAIYKHIQEVSKMYGHLNYLRANTEGGASITIGGFAPTPADLPTSGVPVNTVYITNGDTYDLYVWDGQSWNKLNINSLPVATTEQAGLVQLGTLAGVRSDIPSPTKAVTEELLANYTIGGGGAGVPSGTIVAWWGNPANVPAGWVYCDGSSGTPDLRGKFIKATDNNGEMGGTTGGVANNVLVEANLPVHRHSVSISVTSTGNQGTHYHSFSGSVGGAPAHTHRAQGFTSRNGSHQHFSPDYGNFIYTTERGVTVQAETIGMGGTAMRTCITTNRAGTVRAIEEKTDPDGVHDHTYDIMTSSAGGGGGGSFNGNTGNGGGGSISVGGTVQGNTGNVGTGTAVNNLPPYMELVYIMKL